MFKERSELFFDSFLKNEENERDIHIYNKEVFDSKTSLMELFVEQLEKPLSAMKVDLINYVLTSNDQEFKNEMLDEFFSLLLSKIGMEVDVNYIKNDEGIFHRIIKDLYDVLFLNPMEILPQLLVEVILSNPIVINGIYKNYAKQPIIKSKTNIIKKNGATNENVIQFYVITKEIFSDEKKAVILLNNPMFLDTLSKYKENTFKHFLSLQNTSIFPKLFNIVFLDSIQKEIFISEVLNHLKLELELKDAA